MQIRAFVFDNEKNIRSLLHSILNIRRYEVLSFSEPKNCPIYLEEDCPCPKDYVCGDIFIINNHMMNMTGFEFIEKQTRYKCKINSENKALISTTYTDTEIKLSRKLGCKLFDKISFIDKIDDWLNECEKRIDPNRKLYDLNMFNEQIGLETP